MQAIIRFLVHRGLVVNLVCIFLLAIGLYAALNINREAFPNVNLDRIQIDFAYPGATPDEVERLVVTPIEQELKTLDGIDKMTSISFPGSGRVNLELDPEATNRDRIVSDVSVAVERADLPDDLPDDPKVTEIDGSVFPILQIAVSAPRKDIELKWLGNKIRDDLLTIPGIGRVVITGERKAEIRITVDPKKLQRYRLSVEDLAQLLDRWNINAPGGDITTPTGQKSVRINGEFQSADDVKSLVIRANERGQTLKISDVATVAETLEVPQTLNALKGKPSLDIIVFKKTDADILDTVASVKKYLTTVKQRYGEDIDTGTAQDWSRATNLRLNVLTNNGLAGLILVLLSLVLFLRPSVAVTTTWGLPIIVFSGLFILHAGDVTLNLVSMMGFIMVLGMLVDDAIIVGENITYHMERGMTPKHAATIGAYELIGPVTTTILTTVAAFMPLLFMSGIIGKFIVSIPIVVILLLTLSWLESFFVLPNHVADITRANKHPPERKWLQLLENGYAGLLRIAVGRWGRYVTLLLSFAVLAGAVVIGVNMKFRLFPPVGVEQYLVRVTAPAGTTLQSMHEQMLAIDKYVREHIQPPEYLDTTIIKTGQTAFDEGDPLTQRGDRFGQIRVVYTPAVGRQGHDALADLRRFERVLPKQFPDVEIAFTEIRPGPPTGRPLEAEISSYDPKLSEQAARRLIQFLNNTAGVTGIDSGLTPGDGQVQVVLDRELAAYAGVDLATAARHVRAAVGGLVVSTSRWGTEEIDVTIRFPDSANNIEQLGTLQIPNKRNGLINLSRIARFEDQPGFTTIRHRDGNRIVNVVADIDSSLTDSITLNNEIANNEQQWLGDLYGKVDVRYGGEQEKNMESFRDLAKAFAFAMVGILFILAIQFNNLSYPLIVMLSIPFGIIGIIISFYFHDKFWQPMPLSFFSTLGMVALTGVVVNSALVLLVFVQRAVQEGMDYFSAVLAAGRRRIRAVVLTAATTVVGLLPTAYGWGGLDPLVSPMALALSWGLMFATLVTLITIPAALLVLVDIRNLLRRIFRRTPSADTPPADNGGFPQKNQSA